MEIGPDGLTDFGEPTPERKMRLAIQTGITLADWKHYYDCTRDNSSFLDVCQKGLLLCGRDDLIAPILMG
jgi:hypothetical protein